MNDSHLTTHGHDCWGWGPKHYECAVREIEALRAEVDALREALAGLITWIPSADTYRRLGFDPETPMRVLREARAALSKENSND